ncbi:hypothetical protein HaLaN_25789 [Haematococcus lacustris]|uniref:Uncharacterized protein n=1 Tax=Haematococcus lacustris TaxID=44745 RepID=A0A699ZZ58_HAELA|nr:hypothetical protein HaLaN_25789 [Haematococcus lacustris]
MASKAVGLPVVELEAGRGQAVKLQDRVVEIPDGATFELKVEVLDVFPA